MSGSVLSAYIRDFVVFEVVNEKITKKGARYHQFFAVRLAVQKTLETYFRSVVAGHDPNNINQNIGRWTALAAITRSAEHVATLAHDIFEHFTERTRTLKGKALIVCMERLNCVRLYEALIALPGCPEVKIIMTGNLGEDPPERSAKGYLTAKNQREAIKERMKDLADPLQMVIVCDMWLNGTLHFYRGRCYFHRECCSWCKRKGSHSCSKCLIPRWYDLPVFPRKAISYRRKLRCHTIFRPFVSICSMNKKSI